VSEGAQVYDFVRAHRMREELAELAARNQGVHARVTAQSGNGQLSLDPMPRFANGGGSCVIEGIQFNCTVWSGGAGSA
jgi:hypothetical protein